MHLDAGTRSGHQGAFKSNDLFLATSPSLCVISLVSVSFMCCKFTTNIFLVDCEDCHTFGILVLSRNTQRWSGTKSQFYLSKSENNKCVFQTVGDRPEYPQQQRRAPQHRTEQPPLVRLYLDELGISSPGHVLTGVVKLVCHVAQHRYPAHGWIILLQETHGIVNK